MKNPCIIDVLKFPSKWTFLLQAAEAEELSRQKEIEMEQLRVQQAEALVASASAPDMPEVS